MNDSTATDAQAYDAWIAAGKNAARAAAAVGTSPRTLMRRVTRRQAEIAEAREVIVNNFQGAADQVLTAEQITSPGFPAGIGTPVLFRNLMVSEGIAPATLRPQTVYNWVLAKFAHPAGKYGQMPVETYPGGKGGTRAGVDIEKGIAWYRAMQSA